MIRTLWYYFSFSFTTLILGILSFPAMILQLSGIMFRVAVIWGKAGALLTGMRVKVENREKLYREGTVIVITNHQSGIDIPAIYAGINIPFTWMSKVSMFRIPIVGQAMKAMRCIPVERDNRKKAMESLYTAAEMIQEGRSVVIFPEGTFGNPDGSLRPFKKGGFVLAKLAKVAIQPVTIWGTANIAPNIEHHSMQRFYPGTARMIFHDAIMPQDYEDLEADELSKKLRTIIEAPIEKLQKEHALFRQLDANVS